MKMLLVLLIAIVLPGTGFGATCTGSFPCHACTTCNYCKHCAKDGGTCGVCAGHHIGKRVGARHRSASKVNVVKT
jgi:hypothetical protein